MLVVDDDADIRTVIGATLTDEGMSVGTAGDGREALQRAGEVPPALIILDITLPGLDGYQVADQLRERYGVLPILAITADGRAAEKARRVGAFAYLRKPFELDELVALVKLGLSDSIS
ncbi:MAG TPA: response regulator [Chloroflexota bacterium]|nr:response regulator [Chloroflexota bacterium]